MPTAPVWLSKELTISDRILVTGATGLQGGAVAPHLLKLNKPEVRCLTRRPDSEATKTFKQLGTEVVKADLDDPASLKSGRPGRLHLRETAIHEQLRSRHVAAVVGC